MDNRIIKIRAKGSSIPLKVIPGHFATNHSHINYYIDMTTLKTRLSEAQEVARSLVGLYVNNTIVDTIVCLEGTEIIGAFFAEELKMCIRDSTYIMHTAHKRSSPFSIYFLYNYSKSFLIFQFIPYCYLSHYLKPGSPYFTSQNSAISSFSLIEVTP